MPFVSVTRLHVRSRRYLPSFLVQALRTAMQARSAPGALAVSAINQDWATFWTRTMWESEQAMRAYMLSGSHKTVMPRLAGWCDEAAVVHWVQDGPDLPPWTEIHRRLQAEGRRSRVNHPSANQVAFVVRPFATKPGAEIRLK